MSHIITALWLRVDTASAFMTNKLPESSAKPQKSQRDANTADSRVKCCCKPQRVVEAEAADDAAHACRSCKHENKMPLYERQGLVSTLYI